jgi:hypothetical protein
MLRVDDFLSSLPLLVCRSARLFSGCNTSFRSWDENPCGQSIPETISQLLSDLLREYSRPWLLQRENGTRQRHRLHRAHLRMQPGQTPPS